jgi:membrane protease subunit HflK
MQQIYSNVTKVLVESRQGSNLLYLPLDKIVNSVSGASAPAASGDSAAAAGTSSSAPATVRVVPSPAGDARGRDARSRDRDAR